jgi:hypothetical protein
MIQSLVATQSHRLMLSGRTSPILCGCEDHSERHVGDFVVKLKGCVERGEQGMLSELFASRMASHFGILVPEPVLVEISPGFSDLVAQRHPSILDGVRNSVGLNFGSKLLVGVATWPVDKVIPESMHQSALNVFAFDALIQNPDRRFDNPNLLVSGDDVYVYDHESAFSFLLAIAPSRAPWTLENEVYLDRHAFFRGLKGQPHDTMDTSDFISRLKSLTDDTLRQITADIPERWMGNGSAGIENHLRKLRAHADDFAVELNRRLA